MQINVTFATETEGERFNDSIVDQAMPGMSPLERAQETVRLINLAMAFRLAVSQNISVGEAEQRISQNVQRQR